MEKIRGRESEIKTELTGGSKREGGNNYAAERLCVICVCREQLSG